MTQRLTGASFALLAGCQASPPSLSPSDVASIRRECSEKIASGDFDVKRRTPSRVGFAPEARPAGTPVILYGATWCGVCKLAAGYMARRGIPFVEKDVDIDEANEAERRKALKAAGLPLTTAVPILDVRGMVTVGFFACALEQAWAEP